MSIYIGNLSFDVTEKDLEEVFADYGTVKKISLPRDRETGKMRGFGFVEMENDSEEEKAIADLDEAEWMGRTLKVNKARPREKRSSFSGGNNRKNDYFKRGF
ncbi:MAG: RNA recognition motif domain-containing protein [Prochloraceae cyanobacterium]